MTNFISPRPSTLGTTSAKQKNFAKSINTPIAAGLKLSKFGREATVDPQLYRSIAGALQYAIKTRPEMS